MNIKEAKNYLEYAKYEETWLLNELQTAYIKAKTKKLPLQIGDIKKMIEEAILDGAIENNREEAFNYMMKIKDQFIN